MTAALLTAVASQNHAQTNTVVASPRVFYAIENLDLGGVVRRGITTSAGIPQNGLILAPDTNFREWIYNADTRLIGYAEFRTPSAGQRVTMPTVPLGPPLGPDYDGDGLSDDAEFIIGTDPGRRDTDGDGVSDGAEVLNGSNPLDGLPVSSGIIASSGTPGTAVDVCALNDLAIVADSAAGVIVFNVAGQNPIRIAQVDTPGDALAVACSSRFVAVADGPAGLAIVDITDPPAARILYQLSSAGLGGGNAQAVAAFGELVFVGTDAGWLLLVDLPTGKVLESSHISSRIEDLSVVGDVLYAYTSDGLETFSFDGGIVQLGSAASPSPNGINTANVRGRMFVGGGLAYLVHARGVNVFNVANPASPFLQLQGNEVPNQFGWKQVTLNGSGLMLAAAATSPTFDIPHNIRLYDASNSFVFPTYLTEFTMPGKARAVSIYNGLGYVADGDSGLEVINYLPADNGTNPPTITLFTGITLSSPTNGVAEEGKLLRMTALVTDDVQVRNVEFYVDGVRVATDGNFPFEQRIVTPRRTATKTAFTVRARATDTGGNFAWSDEIQAALVPDATPPRVVRADPSTNAVVNSINSAFIYFSEPMDTSTLTRLLASFAPPARITSLGLRMIL